MSTYYMDYTMDMHHPLSHLNTYICLRVEIFFFALKILSCRISLLQKWKTSWVAVRERRFKDSSTVDVDCGYAVVSSISEQ